MRRRPGNIFGVGLLSRWNPFRRKFIAIVPDNQHVVGRATISEVADLTLFEHDGQVDLLWVDMEAEDAESFVFPNVDAAKAFAADRFSVGSDDWT